MKNFILLITSICFLIAANNSLAQTWLQAAGGNSQDEALAMTIDGQSNIISTGYFSQSARFDNFILGSAGMGDVFISKQNANGDYLWVTKAGGLNSDRAFGITVDNGNNIYITGVFKGSAQFGATTLTSTSNSQDVFVAKLDANGNFIWVISLGGTDTDIANGIDVNANGEVAIAGQYKGTAQFGSFSLTSVVYDASMGNQAGLPSYDGFLVKLNATGIVQWAKNISAEYDDRAMKVVFDNSNQIIVCGQYSDTLNTVTIYPNNSYNAAFLLKIDSNGNDIWFRRLLAPQIMIYDIKTNGSDVFLTGDAKGNININTSPATIVSCNSGDFNVYAMKMNANGYLVWSSTQYSDNPISSRALALTSNGEVTIAGTFHCSFTQFTSMLQPALFNSVGFKDVFIIQYDATGNRVWEKNYGGISDDWVWSMEMFASDQPVIAGSFEESFGMPFGSNFIFHSTVEDLSSVHSNNTLNVCSFSNYGKYANAKGMGSKDILSARPINLGLAPYDYYQRQNNTCQRDTLMPILFPNVDSITACDSMKLFIRTRTTVDYKTAPAWEFNWSIGSSDDTISILSTGWYAVEYGFADDCRRFRDSIYVEIFQSPYLPEITSTNFPIEQAIPVNSCLNKLAKMVNDTAYLTAGNLYPGYDFYWQDPNGTVLVDTTIDALALGTYTLTVISPNGMCSKTQCVTIYDYMDVVGSIGNANLLNPILVLTDSTFNDTDTVVVCKDDFFGVEYFDVNDFANGIPTYLNTFIRWTILQGGFTYQFSSSAPFTFQFHHQEYKALNSGNCVLKAELLHPVTLQVLNSVTRNFYLNVREAPSNLPIINGPTNFCPGDTVLLTVTGGDEYQWSGPGIVGVNSPVNDSVYITMDGTYELQSTTRDTIMDCPNQLSIPYLIYSPSAPPVAMNPSHGVICPNDSVLLTAVPGSNYQWYGATGNVISTSNSVYVTVPGFYYYTFTTPDGCELLSDMAEVKEYSTPFLEADPGTNLCVGGSLTISVESNEFSLVSWLSPLSGNAFSQIISSPGIYQASVSFCNITTLAEIEITQSTVHAEILYSGNDTVCLNEEIVLLADAAGATINWLPGNESSGIFTTNEPGTYILELTDAGGCTDSDTLQLNYYPASVPPVVNDTLICSGSTVQLTALSSGEVSWYDLQEFGNIIGAGDTLMVNIQQEDTSFYVSSFNGTCFSDLAELNVQVNPSSVLPVIFGDSIYCLGDTLMLFTDTLTDVNYQWTGPFGFSDTIQNIEWVLNDPNQAGTYSLQVGDSICSSLPQTFEVIVEIPLLQGFGSTNINLCSNDSLVLSDTLQGIYTWQNGSQTPSYLVNTSGDYYFTFESMNGCMAYSDTLHVISIPSPTLSSVSDTAVCYGSPLLMSSSFSGGTVHWTDTENNFNVFGDTLNISSVNGAMTILVSAADTLGCLSITDSLFISILPNEAAPTILSMDSVCVNDDWILEANSSTGQDYYWFGPNGYTSQSSTDTFPDIQLSEAGIYAVYTMNGYCYSDTAEINLTVIPLPELSIYGDSIMCAGDSLLLSVIASDDFYWNDGDLTLDKLIDTDSSQWYYVVTEHFCGHFYDSVYILVNPLPEIELGPDQTILYGLGTHFSVSEGMDYFWTPSSGLDCDDCSELFASPLEETTYYLMVVDSNGCVARDSVTIFVQNESTCFIPNSFTPNGDGTNDIFAPKVYGLENYQLLVFNRDGEVIFRSYDPSIGWDGTFQGVMSQLGTFVYLVSGVDLNGETLEWRGHVNLLR